MNKLSKDFLKQKKIKRAEKYLAKVARWMSINLQAKSENGTVSVLDITNLVAVGAFYFVLLIFAFPVALPLPYPPGFPSLCGIPIFLLSVQMLLNQKKVILPKFIREYRLRVELIRSIINKSNKILIILSKIIQVRRLEIITSNKFVPIYGLVFIALSVCILIPFPGTNFIPAVGIFICCLGLLFKDGLFVLIGLAIGFAGILIVYFFSAIFVSLIAKFFRFSYQKIANFYIEENSFMFAGGILIGLISAFLIFLLYKLLKKGYDNRKLKKSQASEPRNL